MKHYGSLMARLSSYIKALMHHETIDAIRLIPHVYA